MGICYTYMLYDETNWGWDEELSKEDIIKHIKIDYPVAVVLAEWYGFIVVDLDKISPYGDRIQSLKGRCEKCYFYTDSASYDIQEVKFKETEKEKAFKANEPKHRNAARIEEAYQSWKKRYDSKKLPDIY